MFFGIAARTIVAWPTTGGPRSTTPTASRCGPAAASGSGARWPTLRASASARSPTTARAASACCSATATSTTIRTTARSTIGAPACGWSPKAPGAKARSNWSSCPQTTRPTTTSSRSGPRQPSCPQATRLVQLPAALGRDAAGPGSGCTRGRHTLRPRRRGRTQARLRVVALRDRLRRRRPLARRRRDADGAGHHAVARYGGAHVGTAVEEHPRLSSDVRSAPPRRSPRAGRAAAVPRVPGPADERDVGLPVEPAGDTVSAHGLQSHAAGASWCGVGFDVANYLDLMPSFRADNPTRRERPLCGHESSNSINSGESKLHRADPFTAAPESAWRPVSGIDPRVVNWDLAALTRHPKGVDCSASVIKLHEMAVAKWLSRPAIGRTSARVSKGGTHASHHPGIRAARPGPASRSRRPRRRPDRRVRGDRSCLPVARWPLHPREAPPTSR